jgi:hypothetical protein
MDTAVESGATLRDTLTDAFETVEAAQPSTVGTEAPASSKIAAPETQAQKDERARDEAGKFVKTESKVATPQAQKPNATLSSGTAPQVPAAVASTPADIPRPASWKKDYEAHWGALAPELKQYIQQREKEYQGGVSTYKAEAENARQLNEAIAPFTQLLQQHGREPTEMIRTLFTAHQRLALGSPQDKVQMGVKLIQDYGIDPQALFQVLSGQQPQYQQHQPQSQYQQAAQQPQDIERVVEQALMKKEISNEYQRFITEAPEKYPHYEQVKDTMAGLLQAELAKDYASAYEAALRMPKHADLFEAQQSQQREQEEANARAQTQATVDRARAKTVSVRPATPSGTMTSGKANPSLRDSLSEAFDTVTSSRV